MAKKRSHFLKFSTLKFLSLLLYKIVPSGLLACWFVVLEMQIHKFMKLRILFFLSISFIHNLPAYLKIFKKFCTEG